MKGADDKMFNAPVESLWDFPPDIFNHLCLLSNSCLFDSFFNLAANIFNILIVGKSDGIWSDYYFIIIYSRTLPL